jgi:hypothetical protein
MTSDISVPDAITVGRLLMDVSSNRRLPSSLRTSSRYWASRVEPGLRPGDLQDVMRLLRDVASHRRVDMRWRELASFWAGHFAAILADTPPQLGMSPGPLVPIDLGSSDEPA